MLFKFRSTVTCVFLKRSFLLRRGAVAGLTCLSFLAATSQSQGQPAFEQNFQSGKVVEDFIGTEKNLFDAIINSGPDFKWTVTESSLMGEASSNVGVIVRSTDLPTDSGGIFQFDVDVLRVEQAAASPISFWVGHGLSPSAGTDPFSSVHSRFNINFAGARNGFTFRDVENGDNFKQVFQGRRRVTFVVSNAGTDREYRTPEGLEGKVAPGTWDLWVDNTLVFDDAKSTSPGVPPVNFKLKWSASRGNGSGMVAFTNFTVVPLVP